MSSTFSIHVYKEYFNFAASHFMIFKDGSREPLHGHNYRVRVKGHGDSLDDDMVFDFLNIKPIIKKICDSLDHKLILPGENNLLKINRVEKNFELTTPDHHFFSIPAEDVLILPIKNSSVERIAFYLAHEITEEIKTQYQFQFKTLEVEVEESPGQSATYIHQAN